MRMWGVDPRLLCARHLSGEHVEMHMFVGTIQAEKSIAGYVNTGLVEVHNIVSRHDTLAAEMIRRGMNHRSPIIKIQREPAGKIDIVANLAELARRCPACKARQEELLNLRSGED